LHRSRLPTTTSTPTTSDAADSAYVVLRTEAPQLLSVWAGEDAAIASKGSAASHAAELLTDLEDHVTIGKEAQGSESADFLSLFPSISYGTPAATEGPAESLEEASDEADEPEDVPGAPAAATASKKKKKKKNKNKGGNGGAPPAAPEPVQEAAAIETEALDAEFELEEAVALPVLPSSPVKAEEPVAEEPEPAPQPEVTAPSPVPAAASPTAAASSARSPAEAAQTPAKSPTPTKAATPLARTPTPAAASPARKPAASPASAAAPAASPVATKSYLADSAKAWGGATAVPAVGVQGKVDRVIPYEELKGEVQRYALTI